jgi:N-acetylated-alpha-linked acidic dipeptidase
MKASPSLAHLVQEAAQDVPHPTLPGKTLWDARLDDGPFGGPRDAKSMVSNETLRLEGRSLENGVRPLGSGSDYTDFLQRLGVSYVELSFSYIVLIVTTGCKQ